MKGIHSLAGLLLLIIVQGSWQIPLQETGDTSRLLIITETEPTDEARELLHVKRHSQGMFTNDYSKYLEEKSAKEFVEWLKNGKSKRSGMTEEELTDEPGELTNVKRHSQGMFTNDFSKYLEEEHAKEFVEWLKNGFTVWNNLTTCRPMVGNYFEFAQLGDCSSDGCKSAE
ncbi:UNVERIFIED_CONTAM: hypothetical protein FKN15_027834 [Acipenser sinensis]